MKTSWPSFVPLSAHRCCASTICLHSDGDKDRRTMKARYQVAVLLALLSLLNFCWWQSLTWSLIFSSYDWSMSKKRGHCFGELCTPLMYCGCTGCKALINWAGMLLYFLFYSWFGQKRCPDWNSILQLSEIASSPQLFPLTEWKPPQLCFKHVSCNQLGFACWSLML